MQFVKIYPFPQSLQHASKSSAEIAEICGFSRPSDAIQTRSDMASVAPNAQHEPQFDWSRISAIVGHWDHFSRASNDLGMLSSPNKCFKRKIGNLGRLARFRTHPIKRRTVGKDLPWKRRITKMVLFGGDFASILCSRGGGKRPKNHLDLFPGSLL
uniref:Uncharacterized protein n=1 Tax=Romanomermis culicivorax TaxID=13658 RepID=A0A915KYI0_ROMCU